MLVRIFSRFLMILKSQFCLNDGKSGCEKVYFVQKFNVRYAMEKIMHT